MNNSAKLFTGGKVIHRLFTGYSQGYSQVIHILIHRVIHSLFTYLFTGLFTAYSQLIHSLFTGLFTGLFTPPSITLLLHTRGVRLGRERCVAHPLL